MHFKTAISMVFVGSLCWTGVHAQSMAGSAAKNAGMNAQVIGAYASAMEKAKKEAEAKTPAKFTPDMQFDWILKVKVDPKKLRDVQVYDVDLFDTPVATIKAIKDKKIKAVCYFSAGSYENWRADKTKFFKTDYGKPLDGWEGENWLNIKSANVKKIMKERLSLAKQKGCDAVEPDNVDGYTQDSGFKLTAADQIAYNRFLADEAHKLGLAIALKNSPAQVKDLHKYFDFAVVEQCNEYNECDAYSPFIKSNKAVFIAEYNEKYSKSGVEFTKMCQASARYKMKPVLFSMELDNTIYKACR